jgi:hypothetical protein
MIQFKFSLDKLYQKKTIFNLNIKIEMLFSPKKRKYKKEDRVISIKYTK